MRRHATVLTGLMLVASTFAWGATELRSDFGAGAEDWRVGGDATDFVWLPIGGNPDGYVKATDQGLGKYWYFATPLAWAGDWRPFRTLSYDFKSSTLTNNGVADYDVWIVGSNGGSLKWKGVTPSTTFKRITIPLAASTFGVSQAEFRGVMQSVAEMRIRGEFSSVIDTGSLDNVIVTNVTGPIAGRLTGIPTYKVTCTNNTTGQTVSRSSVTTEKWNCESFGLAVEDGDKVTITLDGKVAQ
jgi:hypothetical protein